jgi:activator of HSP90 ATPase
METIRQTVVVDCPAHAIYEAFMNQTQHAELTGAPALIENRIGGLYAAYNEDLVGEFTKLVPDEWIVLLWRSEMPTWPEDHFAVISLELSQSYDGTTIEFTASDVPEQCADAIIEGWQDMYWEPLQRKFSW